MRLRRVPSLQDQIQVSGAAARAYRRLLGAIGASLKAHPCGNGGLICEYRASRARPVLWRISPEGQVLPDSRYSFTLMTFTAATLPSGV